MTYDDWIAAGYKRYEVKNREMNKLADFILQKRFDDEDGKKYYITVYCYDRTNYPPEYLEMCEGKPIGFMPTVHFSLGEGCPFFNIEMNGVEDRMGVEHVEEWFDAFWDMCNRPYYERNEA